MAIDCEGMEADLIVLEKNPAEDISNMQFIDEHSHGRGQDSSGMTRAPDSS